MAERRIRLPLAALVTAAVLLAGCSSATGRPADTAGDPTAAGPATTNSTATNSTATSTTAASTSAVPDDVRTAVAELIDTLNATAAGAVADQQAVLRQLVDPSAAADQAACAPASITIKVDPVLANLAVADPVAPPSEASDTAVSDTAVSEPAVSAPAVSGTAAPAPAGQSYRVPALLEVYTDGYRTGTDLTNFRVVVRDGRAATMALCLV